jgi:hypothetical protein
MAVIARWPRLESVHAAWRFCRVVFEARASWQKLKREEMCKIGHAQGVHENV